MNGKSLNNNADRADPRLMESVQLLGSDQSLSSDPEILFHAAPPPVSTAVQTRRKIFTKRKSKRGDAGGHGGGRSSPQSPAGPACGARAALRVCLWVLVLAGAALLGWAVSSLHQQVERLQEQAAVSGAAVAGLADLKRTVLELRAERRNQSAAVDWVRERLTSLQAGLQTVAERVEASASAPAASQQQQQQQLADELDALKKGLAGYEAALADLRPQLDELRRRQDVVVVDGVNGVNATLAARIDRLASALDQHKAAVLEVTRPLGRRVDDVADQLVRLQAQQTNTTLTLSHVLGVLATLASDGGG